MFGMAFAYIVWSENMPWVIGSRLDQGLTTDIRGKNKMASSRVGFLRTSLGLAAGLLAVGSLLAASTSDAEAAFKLRLSTAGGASAIIVDQGAGDNANTAVGEGVISFSGDVGNFTLNFTVGSSKPQIGSASLPQMNLISFNATTSGAPDILTIELTDTDFIGPLPSANFNTVVNGTRIPGSLSFAAYLDSTNTEFGTGTEIASFGPLGSGAASAGATTLVTTSAPYSLTMIATVDHLTKGIRDTTTFDANISVPEPKMLTLFGIGLLGIGLLARRRDRREIRN
jgi:hypothetical protein